MPTPTDRLEIRKQLADCRVCAWLATLSESDRREWQKAIVNNRFGATMVADEINIEIASCDPSAEAAYHGPPIGEKSVQTHRNRGHR